MVGIASFSFSDLFSDANSAYSMFVARAGPGLGVLVLLFIGHALYQQIQINHIRRQLMEQVFAVDKVGTAGPGGLQPGRTGFANWFLYNRRYAEQRLESEIALIPAAWTSTRP